MRLDLFVEHTYKDLSRSKAQEMIRDGKVQVNGMIVFKPSCQIREGGIDTISVERNEVEWVSRGARKLLQATDMWKIDVKNKICLDIGASTGGFTQVLIEKGAQKVYALDVGHNQLHNMLQDHERVVSLEGLHIKDVDTTTFQEHIDIVVIDVSFISLEHVLPYAIDLIDQGGLLVALVKPQFEVGKGKLKKGLVKDPDMHLNVVKSITAFAQKIGFKNIDIIESPIKGSKGNKEFLMKAEK